MTRAIPAYRAKTRTAGIVVIEPVSDKSVERAVVTDI